MENKPAAISKLAMKPHFGIEKKAVDIYISEIEKADVSPEAKYVATFDIQFFELNKYMALSTEPAQNTFAKNLSLQQYSRGMGAIGLPGDLSSTSRFVKAASTRMNSASGESELESVSQFLHILGSVDQQRGCVHLGDDAYEITIYTSCCNLDKGIYYYNTYENHQITAVDMHKADLDGAKLCTYPLRHGENVLWEN